MEPVRDELQSDPLRILGHEWHCSTSPFQCRDGVLHAGNSHYLQDALANECDLLGIFQEISLARGCL